MKDEIRKGIHISLLKSTHRDLKIKLIRKGLTFQEMFESLALKIVDDDNAMEKIIDEILNVKNTKGSSKFGKSDAESVYDSIESTNPFSKSWNRKK